MDIDKPRRSPRRLPKTVDFSKAAEKGRHPDAIIFDLIVRSGGLVSVALDEKGRGKVQYGVKSKPGRRK